MIKTAILLAILATANAFVPFVARTKQSTALFSSESAVAAPSITGEELEVMMSEWDSPLVIDAYATWYVVGYVCMLERSINFVCG